VTIVCVVKCQDVDGEKNVCNVCVPFFLHSHTHTCHFVYTSTNKLNAHLSRLVCIPRASISTSSVKITHTTIIILHLKTSAFGQNIGLIEKETRLIIYDSSLKVVCTVDLSVNMDVRKSNKIDFTQTPSMYSLLLHCH